MLDGRHDWRAFQVKYRIKSEAKDKGASGMPHIIMGEMHQLAEAHFHNAAVLFLL
jgi:hypothetical protein